ncbi:2-oxo-hept-4-ene-1,7-dioate hydratase [Carnimonas bestiolae]|uniref:2-oxo-hept-4-ene-1,7-dioate hydratase n=1 Tax=Carnimonas bestiolae TaxID=3402172 RepID=UPI003EDBD9D9
MLSSGHIQQSVDWLEAAEQQQRQIGLLSLRFPDMTLDDAYAVQKAWIERKKAAGRRLVGWKIGLTSRAMQSLLEIDTLDSGALLDDMEFGDGATIPAGRFIQPRIEAELCFVLHSPLKGPGVTLLDVLNATDYVVPALEILDTRVIRADPATGKKRTVIDTVADNAANGGFVTGGRPMRVDAVDLRWAGAIVTRNGVVEETGLGAAVLNHPATGIAWLANRLAEYGEAIDAGQWVLSGSFIRTVEARSGDTIVGDFGPLGTVAVYFQ